MRHITAAISAPLLVLLAASPVFAQGRFGPQPPEFDSPEVAGDRMITFRIHAPIAEEVRLTSSDLPDIGFGVEMEQTNNGVWESTVGPVPAGACRYSLFAEE